MNADIGEVMAQKRAGTYQPNPVDEATFGDMVDNWFTGNLDYRREVALQQQAQEFNAQQALLDYERTKELRKTAYQDAYKDAEAAGLNPSLLYYLGSGGAAMTPSLSGARSNNPGHHSSGAKLGLKDILLLVASLVSTAGKVAAAANTAEKALTARQGATKVAQRRLDFDKAKYEDWLSSNVRRNKWYR